MLKKVAFCYLVCIAAIVLVHHQHFATEASSMGWVSTLQQWWWHGNAENTINAKLCVKLMIHRINAQEMSRRSSSNGIKYQGFTGTCYCGAFFGNKLSQPKLGINALKLVIENRDKLGMGSTGYVVQSNSGSTPEERYGIVIYCDHDGQARVTDQLTRLANPEIAGFI